MKWNPLSLSLSLIWVGMKKREIENVERKSTEKWGIEKL